MLIRRHRDLPSFVRSLHLHYSVRLHAAILLISASLAGLLVSRLLLWMGLEAPFLRFPIAVVISYGLFLLFVDWWLRYIGIKRVAVDDVPDPGSFPSSFEGGHGSAGETVTGGGGSFDGGGASSGFDPEAGGQAAALKGEAVLRAKGSAIHLGLEAKAQGGLSAGDALSGAAGAGEFIPILLLITVLAAFAGAAGWIIASTPMVLIETAVEVAVASGLIRSMSRSREATWFESLFSRTIWKVAALAGAAILLGIAVRMVDPGADTIGEGVARVMGR
ncbi:MAG: hypothetical protein ACXWAC_08615 [Usitatibacter sp.]